MGQTACGQQPCAAQGCEATCGSAAPYEEQLPGYAVQDPAYQAASFPTSSLVGDVQLSNFVNSGTSFAPQVGELVVKYPGQPISKNGPREIRMPGKQFDGGGGWARTRLNHVFDAHKYWETSQQSAMADIYGKVPAMIVWDWVFLRTDGWVLQFWKDGPVTAKKLERERPEAWYDVRKVSTVSCKEVGPSREAPACFFELEVVFNRGIMQLRFEKITEARTWAQHIIALLREWKRLSGGERLKALDVLWVGRLRRARKGDKQLVDEMHAHNLFNLMDVNKDGKVSVRAIVGLYQESFSHRKLLLLAYDHAATNFESHVFGAVANPSVDLLAIYKRRMTNECAKMAETWLLSESECALRNGFVKFPEFKALMPLMIFPEDVCKLENQVWYSHGELAERLASEIEKGRECPIQ
eukprot:gnl/TRDRNA2_/TRDRNA2_43188_c1_seq1.p1 gnl/TRDRNA2_/TRDRNA2_43188_c1~~gnl/TRDRNA2_/TRDRNA2_43188_c1_seq1.p1  ORF type:complete len:411 (-),score=70.07 gnl/TRDRNA2_/TRDRNA2_43188_c1_seq1:86-1318(-)